MEKHLLKYYLSLLIFLFACNAFSHPFHISVTNIDFNKNKLDICIKAMNDDLTSLGWGKDQKSNSIIIEKLCNEISIIINNNTELKENYIKHESKEDATWFYFECNNNDNINSIEIIDKIFIDIFIDQQNLLFINTGEQILSKKFTFDNYKTSIILKK